MPGIRVPWMLGTVLWLTCLTVPVGAQETAQSPWVTQKGLDVFVLNGLKAPYSPASWDIAAWGRVLDGLKQMGITLIQVPRARWAERPPESPEEEEQAAYWQSVLRLAKDRGMRTAVVSATTFHGTPEQPWFIYSPNHPGHENWKQLERDYDAYAELYGDLVDEWHFVDDPGGCAVCSGHGGWRGKVTAECDPEHPVCTVSDFLALAAAQQEAIRRRHPAAVVVAHTWSLEGWWGKSAAYDTHLDEFIDHIANAPKEIVAATHGLDPEITKQLQLTGRALQAWCFYLFDHEWTYGMTRIHFHWMREYLKTIRQSGLTTTIPHTPFPTMMLPAVFTYAALADNLERPLDDILHEFAALLVESEPNVQALASALEELAAFYDTIVGVASWDTEKLKPLAPEPPYDRRYTEEQLGHLVAARAAILRVQGIREVSGISMLLTPAEWIRLIQTQIVTLHDAVHADIPLHARREWLARNHGRVLALPNSVRPEQAAALLAEYHALPDPHESLDRYAAYLNQFLEEGPRPRNPAALIHRGLREAVTNAQADAYFRITHETLEFAAPGHAPITRNMLAPAP